MRLANGVGVALDELGKVVDELADTLPRRFRIDENVMQRHSGAVSGLQVFDTAALRIKSRLYVDGRPFGLELVLYLLNGLGKDAFLVDTQEEMRAVE